MADRLWNGCNLITHPILILEDDTIVSVGTQDTLTIPPGTRIVEFAGHTLAPAFFDVHIHGARGHDIMEATPEALEAVSGFLASRGTGTFFATTVTAPLDATLHALEGLARLLDAPPEPGHAHAAGIHLEGPFLSHTKRGVHPPAHLLEPDIAIFDRMLAAADGHVKLLTLAPELPGAVELAAHAAAQGVRVSVGHSNATAAETRSAIAAGATSATHTFNAMRPLDHREPGILGTVLATDTLYAELICDLIHTAPEMAEIWWRTKGAARGILVTDAMSATGMPDGEYLLGGFPVQVHEGRAMAGGVLAGSVLTLDRALANLMAATGAPLEQALRALTVNPAAMTGVDAGSVQPGGRADFAVVTSEGKLMASIVGGAVSA